MLTSSHPALRLGLGPALRSFRCVGRRRTVRRLGCLTHPTAFLTPGAASFPGLTVPTLLITAILHFFVRVLFAEVLPVKVVFSLPVTLPLLIVTATIHFIVRVLFAAAFPDIIVDPSHVNITALRHRILSRLPAPLPFFKSQFEFLLQATG
ncbi:uncharacterized protein BO97DRAFT_24370 [Aspergillus homomorphus CBS 101889]|uniref:Uncharacterized protein n=1 Tax=Aspergillus homomorphus (strain CBS 101889) TaxID=1450537 RepID=A0A395I226_ASPHC|nr:hypothetical protein BO97DRAFT_24370 [Aspergillus homomorphus CBS 101889]RAL13739.1 hypothetical protein BO97DRAFT_24370 [Aspergillus homomorphus CBS 101889]